MTVEELIEKTEQSLKFEIVDTNQNILVEAGKHYFPTEILEAEINYINPEWDRKVLKVEIIK